MSTAAQNTPTIPDESSLIAEQLRRAYRGPAWHGPSLKAILLDVGEENAQRRPPNGAHSIHEIALHVAAWMRIARERLSATQARSVSDEEDWPAPRESWTKTLQILDREVRELEEAIRRFPPAKLQEPAPAVEAQTFYVLLHGIVQHTLYHAGQIILLNK
jgi:uncharacterized damage-inducible protein DinB